MKKVLILVLSSQKEPYGKMIETQKNTWDSFEVEGTETVYYVGEPVKRNADKIIYFPVKEEYAAMGRKALLAFQWCLDNKEFDYIARVHSSTYVDKKKLIKFAQTLEDTNVLAGVEIKDKQNWLWGGGHYLISRDVIKRMLDNQEYWNHSVMEDVALSHLGTKIGVPFTEGNSCSIDNMGTSWRAMCYGGSKECFLFNDFKNLRLLENQFFYRVKQDGKRESDKYLMEQIFEALK